MNNSNNYGRLYTVSLDGEIPKVLLIPQAEHGTYSPDGTQIAYTPIRDSIYTWRRYRGGCTTPIWIFDLQSR